MDVTSPSTCIHSSHAESAQPNGMCEERGQRECIVGKKDWMNCKFPEVDFTFLITLGLTKAITTSGDCFLYVPSEKG